MFHHSYTIGSAALVLIGLLGCKDRNASPEIESAALTVEDTTAAPTRSGKFGSIAEKVVGQSAGVTEGDLVLLFGSEEDLPLLEDVAVQIRKQGGSSIVTVATNKLNRRLYDEVPAKYDTAPPEGMLKLAGIIDVVIGTEAGEAGCSRECLPGGSRPGPKPGQLRAESVLARNDAHR